MKLTSRNGRLSCVGCLLALPWIFLVVLMAGCPQGGGGNGNGNDNDNTGSPGSGRGEIITPSSSFGLSLLDPPFQVRYSVPEGATDVRGYRFPVADISLNSPAIGDEVTIAVDLPAGSNQFFDFDPAEAGVGFHRVGVSFFEGSADFAESSGVIQVQGPPDPVFILPDQPLTIVQQGDVVTVTFDARDPEGQVQWRVFYLATGDSTSAPPDRIGTQLAIGSGNAGNVSFRTEGLAEDSYTLGISATDSGMSVAATVAAGQLDRIVTVVTDTPRVRVVGPDVVIVPTITITNPGTSDITLFRDELFTIRFTATVPQPGASGTVEVFYDTDTNVNNGFTIISDDLTDADTEVEWPIGVPDGTYFVGATIRDGVNAPVTDYSSGRVIVVRNVTLTVTEPNTTLAVAPNTPVSIRWTTNAPDDAGTVDVFAQRLNNLNQPTGAIIPIVTAGSMSLRTATFTSAATGLFQITVRLNITGGTTITQNAPRPVRVSTLPAIAWLGSIVEPTPRVDGAIFGGVNFEDNAGSAFDKADDFDDDGTDEFIIAARYAKPFFVNPDGIGVGEAYLIYGEGGANRLSGVYNLNAVGTSSLRGVVLTGIRTEGNFGLTEGLSDVLSVPDADGDGKEELVFGFPKVESRDIGHVRSANLTRANQFLGGGVVIVSSDNSVLANPTQGNPVINLDLVGQDFSQLAITPLDRDLALEDRQTFQEPEDEAEDGDCIDGSDNVVDTVIGPAVGFVSKLALSQAINLFLDGREPPVFFSPINPEPPTEENCPTVFSLTPEGCVLRGTFQGTNTGSGFYPPLNRCFNAVDGAIGEECTSGADCQDDEVCMLAREPLGARIVGREEDDRFGSTLTFNDNPQGRAELIFSAPTRDATPDEILGVPSEIDGAGVAYIFGNRHFWGEDALVPGVPPTPFQYIVNFDSHCGAGEDQRAQPIVFFPESAPSPGNDPDAGALKVAGSAGDEIQVLLGIDDFNRDGRNDLAIGAPEAARVYITYRRQTGSIGLEGDFRLDNLDLPIDDPDRLDGLLISSTAGDHLGASLASGFDFNNDGFSDLAIGSPNAGNGVGEVIIVFGGTGVTSQEGGISVSVLLTQTRTSTGAPVAARIRGSSIGAENGQFGFNVANGGDVDGDGLDDLLIAAPHASPRFDADPNDGVDQLTAFGVDMNLDGIRDQVPGDDELRQAGVVYVILGKNRLDQLRFCQGTSTPCSSAAECTGGAACTLTDSTISIDQLGSSRLRGLMIAGRRAGDYLGGGDAGDTAEGGNEEKEGMGRSQGLDTAGDVDGDGRDDILIGAILADPRRDNSTGNGVRNGGEAYLFYGSNVP